ncbi:MAG: IPExxxVDY family protein [bacterium]|nr:IPExxxVDY family protein [bacterium]
MAKHVLNSSDDDIDFVLIGISCLDDQYSVAALINDSLKLKLFLSDYIPFHLKEGRIFKFSLYRFLDEELGLEYFFIPNTSNFEQPQTNAAKSGLFAGLDVDESVRLIKELPKTDYFLLLKGEDLHNYQFKIMEKLKQSPDLMNVQAIDIEDLPSRRNLIF